MYTDYHSQYWAHALTLKSASDSIENLSRSISNARVDLNPHQVDAALFAFRSPLAKGCIMADEVGLGKTIEAGIVIAQRWAERKRKILLILPATLRKQWQQELEEKFFLSTLVHESRNFNQLKKLGHLNPFAQKDKIVACSYHFAASKAAEVSQIQWDTVVIDEAHRMRNVYKTSNKLAKRVSEAVSHAPKLLLTATPLQNSLMELYGLVSVIDSQVFGDASSFRDRYVKASSDQTRNEMLRERLKPLCTRTLRKQVLEYVKYTNRVPITQEFLPSDEEHQLYDSVSAYLQRESLLALPAAQRTLMTLVLRKLLASSSFAISRTLRRLANRLEDLLQANTTAKESADETEEDEDLLGGDFETLGELEDEWDDDDDVEDSTIDPELIKEELAEIRRYADLSESIRHNAKGDALLKALRTAFDKAHELGGRKKAVIFTESRRTQDYLFELLSDNGFRDRICLMNGSNNDPKSKEIYKAWQERHKDEQVVSGSRIVDTKAAIVEEFRDRSTILIATEAGAEGINLQFCSLVVNYDLPWNPQRIEQRIGRCHRYGQESDVVVVNFLNKRNAADQRVYQLLDEKFQLFNGVFGASDEILGTLESGMDVERMIAGVYQTCRSPDEIAGAFDQLQAELEEKIQSRMSDTRRTLLENFDEEVSERLKVHRKQAHAQLSRREQQLLKLTQHELEDHATFDPKKPRFFYTGSLAQQGNYSLSWKQAEKHGDIFYRIDHPLATKLITDAKDRKLGQGNITFDYQAHGARVAVIEKMVGQSGWIEVCLLSVNSLDTEEHLVFAAQTDGGKILDTEVCKKLIEMPARVTGATDNTTESLGDARKKAVRSRMQEIELRNSKHYQEEVAKIEHWSEDVVAAAERQLDQVKAEVRAAKRASQEAETVEERMRANEAIRDLEKKKRAARQKIFEIEDEIEEKRDALIDALKHKLTQDVTTQPLFTIRWKIA